MDYNAKIMSFAEGQNILKGVLYETYRVVLHRMVQ